MKGIIKTGLAALLLSFASGQVLADTTLPPVIVHGLTIDNVRFNCRSVACADMLANFGGVPVSEPLPATASIGSEGQLPLPKDFVCAVLKSMQPDDCSMSSPPSAPGFDAGWRANGCGTGPLANLFLSALMEGLFSDHYSGDLNAPLELSGGSKVSFLTACNNHDRCWGSGSDRGRCDLAFLGEMRSVCSHLGGNDQYSCYGMASAYHAAVASDRATPHYDASLANFTCAAWASDMKQNGCS
jgi:hypothetical protein